jgi:hypothetical protein|uniref:Peptidase S74 domain-containing protein n=1 Tax=viral metagenome TaxID=1070528 RepID=A0A6C0CWQ0_9ZZZZ
MSFTSNSWKQSGGLNRNKTYQNVKSDQMTPSNLNITEKLGVENSTTPNISNFESSPTTFLYNFQNGQNFNNNIAYYSFNKPINNTGISNESLNPLLYIPSNFDLNYRGSGTSLSLVSSPFNQNATQFSQNAKTLISDICYNTQNIFGTDPGNSVSYAITVSSYIYISSDASNFCFFGMDNLNQDALTNNGNITTGISNESFYLWYPDNDGKATIYYTTISPASDQPYGFSSQVDIVLKDKWHALTLTLNGQYVYINQNGNTVFKRAFSVGTKVPNQPIAINLSSKSYDSNTNSIISNSATNYGNIQLLDYNIFNFSADPSTVQQISQFRDSIKTINNANEPNRNLYLNYTIGENINYLASKIIAGNGIGNNGSLTNFGEFNNFSIANFYDKTTFYGPVTFDSSTNIVYDSSINSTLEIYTLPGKAGTVTSSFLIENAGAVPGNSFNPTMVVYNGTSTQINPPLTTQGLVFSISGENVSVGDIFGSHTFDVSGSSNLNGNLTVSGSVGIGKLTPNSDYRLDMYGNLLLTAKGTGVSQQPTLTLQYDTSPYTYISSSSITDPTSSFSGQLTFQAGSFSFNNSIDVSGTGNFTDNLTVNNPNANSALIHVIGPGVGGTYVMYGLDTFSTSDFTPPRSGPAVQIRATDTGGFAANLSFWTAENALPVPEGEDVILQDAVERMTITTTGKVGIGTDTPGYTLDVSGTGNFTDNLTVNNNTEISGNLSANNVGPSSDNQLEPNVASAYLNSVSPFSSSSLSQLNMNGYMFTRAILNYNELNTSPTGLIFGTGNNTNQSDYLSLVTSGLTRLYILPGGTVGIGTTNPNNSYILDVNGNINVTGSITSTGSCSCSSYNTTSDLRLKENITDLDKSLEKICNIRGVSYNLKSDENKTKISGVIAQEVMEHIPEAVNNMDSEKLSVNYNSIIAHLIESVKELKREIEELKSKN